MLPVSKWVIAGCSMAGILCTTLPEQGRAAEALTPRLQTQILNMLASRDSGAGRCIPTQKMGNLIASHPASAQKIVEFTSGKLAARPDLLGTDCACPTELAAASIDVVPHMAGPLRRVLEDRYPDCAAAVETAMAHTLGGIAPGAGNTDQPSNSTLLRSAAAPNDGSDPTQISGLSGDESSRARSAAADLPPDLQAEILEALESRPERENQCIAANAFGELVQANPEQALAIMEFADVKLSSKGRLLGDECICPIELATATVNAVPELTIPVRRALDDRYPECTEPAAAGRNGSRRLPPEPPCLETASPSC